ncbi:MAG TPA: hypothetical protein VK364_05020 [Hymenobacter sp.]|nr:hypothetical protein [Hymenobacter sp.]
MNDISTSNKAAFGDFSSDDSSYDDTSSDRTTLAAVSITLTTTVARGSTVHKLLKL